MQLLLHLLSSLSTTSIYNSNSELSNQSISDNCPKNFTLSGVSQDFGPWRPHPSQNCNWSLQVVQYGVGAIVSLTIANMGLGDSVKIGPVLLTNRTYVKQSITVMRNTTIEVKSGPNTQLVIEFSAAAYSVSRSAHLIDEYTFTSDRQSFVFYVSQWLPNQYHLIAAKENDMIVLQISQQLYVREHGTIDLLQWSNVLILDERSQTITSMLDILESGKFVSSLRSVLLFLTQPVTLQGVVLANTGNNMAAFNSYGSVFGIQKDATISLGQTGGRSCFTVLAPPRDGTSITIYTADPGALITVAGGGPDKDQKITVPLDKLPLRIIGNIWTFYLSSGSGSVLFGVN